MSLINSIKIYGDIKIITMLVLGLACGIPLVLTGSTLSVWLLEVGIEKSSIGLFSMVAIPYSLKFLWSPIFDFIKIPYLTNILGRRKSWLILIQLSLIISLILLSYSSPENNLLFAAIITLLVSFLSASQDIIVDAYRIELLPKNYVAPGLSSYIIGYRFGMLLAGAAALFLAEFLEWGEVYLLLTFLIFICMTFVFFINEPDIYEEPKGALKEKMTNIKQNNIIAPFVDFMTKKKWFAILLFVILFKLADSFIGHMANIFYIEIGFSKMEIAAIVKTYGLFATLIGIASGGSIVHRFGMYKGMIICGVFQAIANLFYVLQNDFGYDTFILCFTISIENFSSGMGTAAFLAYLSRLCTNSQYTATQYALLSSLASLGRSFISSITGIMVDYLDWNLFFIISSSLAIPSMCLYIYIYGDKKQSI